jgi:hypothetical protein
MNIFNRFRCGIDSFIFRTPDPVTKNKELDGYCRKVNKRDFFYFYRSVDRKDMTLEKFEKNKRERVCRGGQFFDEFFVSLDFFLCSFLF